MPVKKIKPGAARADKVGSNSTKRALNPMAAIILGKNLLSDDELIEFAFSADNQGDFNLRQLRTSACDAAMLSSLILIRMMKAERIYIQCQPHPTPPEQT